MKEKILQDKLIELIDTKNFLESILKKEVIEEALRVDQDENYLPDFSIDYLLKRKYSESANRVLDSLSTYELISGKSIKNISLEKKELLYPDCLLYNKETQQIIIIENKTSGKTEREAITELFGYSNEINNHLPFISNFEISYIIISTNYDTLLDHSISSHLLKSETNLLCLVPINVINDLKFEIHFPTSWTDLGQSFLPKHSFCSYTLCLKKNNKETNSREINKTIDIALDLLYTEAIKTNSSGFFLFWKNSLNTLFDFDYGITIYLMNSYVFLENAIDKKFAINTNSTLYKYLKNYIDENGPRSYPKTIFKIGEKAKKLLNNVFDTEWETASDWEFDSSYHINKLQRLPLALNSWGAIGDFLRYYYLHPAVQKHIFIKEEASHYYYNSPIIGLQIINILSGNILFKYGKYSATDLFKFGLQLQAYSYSCHNLLNINENKKNSAIANYHWTLIELIASIREIRLTILSSKNNFGIPPKLNINSNFEDIDIDYEKQIESFIEWFTSIFINEEDHFFHSMIFNMAYRFGAYFNPLNAPLVPAIDRVTIEDSIKDLFSRSLKEIVADFKSKKLYLTEENKEILHRFLEIRSLNKISLAKAIQLIDDTPSINYIDNLENNLLPFVDSTVGPLFHQLADFKNSVGIDWKWFKDISKKRYNQGLKYAVIIIEANGEISIGQLSDEELNLSPLKDDNEIYLKYYVASGVSFTQKYMWDQIISGKIFEDFKNISKRDDIF